MVTLGLNTSQNRIELRFNPAPSEDTKRKLKDMGWKWHGRDKCWYNKDTPEERDWAVGFRDDYNRPAQGEHVPEPAVDQPGERMAQAGDANLDEATVPDSGILHAKLSYTEDGVQQIRDVWIVSDEHRQRGQDVYWVGRVFAMKILAAIRTGTRRLEHGETACCVAEYTAYEQAERYMSTVVHFLTPENPQTVYVFAHRNLAQFEGDRYELVWAMVPRADGGPPEPMAVYYDREQDRYFINEASYETYRERYGLPYLRLRPVEREGRRMREVELNAQSELKLLGYNVSAAEGLSAEERRRLLCSIMDSGVLSREKIINHLEWLIYMAGANTNMENAVGEWRADLEYVSGYDAENRRKIWVREFKSRCMG